jgi:hypothetical protein
MMRVARLMVLGILGIILVVGAAISGGTKKDKEPPADDLPKLNKHWLALNLTKEQLDKLGAIQRKSLPKSSELEKKRHELKNAETDELLQMLTDAQKAEIIKNLSSTDSRDKKKDDADKTKKPKEASARPPGWETLKLSAEQEKKLSSVRTDYGFKIGESERQIAEIRAADKADMVKVLNATQKARLLKHADDNSGKGLEMNKDK